MVPWNPEEYNRQSKNQQAWARKVISKMSLKGNEHLLDIGCGDGKVTAELAKLLPNGKVVGVDRSPEMIRFSREHFQTANYPNLSFEVADASELTFRESFDFVTSFTCLHWVKDHNPVLQGFYRSLRPGGRIFLHFGGKGTETAIHDMLTLIREQDSWQSYFDGFVFPWSFYDVETYRPWLAASGLRERRLQLLPYEGFFTEEGLKGWIRSTWLPFLERLPAPLHESFISEAVKGYLERHPLGDDGQVRLLFRRLEVEAEK